MCKLEGERGKGQNRLKNTSKTKNKRHRHTHTHIYIYIYIMVVHAHARIGCSTKAPFCDICTNISGMLPGGENTSPGEACALPPLGEGPVVHEIGTTKIERVRYRLIDGEKEVHREKQTDRYIYSTVTRKSSSLPLSVWPDHTHIYTYTYTHT